MWTPNLAAPSFSTTLCRVPGGRAGAYATVRTMRALVKAARTTPQILELAWSIIRSQPQFDYLAEANSLFSYVQHRIRYTRDVIGVETLADPITTARRMGGDCDDKSTLLAALLESVGFPTRFVLARYSSNDFEHVYLETEVNGAWLAADTTVAEPFGTVPPGAAEIWIEKV